MTPSDLDAARVIRPRGLADVRDAMLDSAGPLLFRGCGTKLHWGNPAEHVEGVIDATEMTDVLTYNPADATVSVQAGIPLAALQRVLSEHDQWLAIDPPAVDAGATVGGVFAAGDAGPSRLRYGTMRDLVIGATFVLSDGTVGRTGGFVIKNVAGYDMAKLLCGSLGTLAFVAELVLRVHPRPPASATVRVPADVQAATRMSTVLSASTLEPVAVDWAEQALWIRITGHPDAVKDRVERVPALLGAADVDVLDGDDEAAAWHRLIAALAGDDGQTVVRAACLPTQLPDAVQGLVGAAEAAGVTTDIGAHAMLGVMTARLSGGAPAAHAACVAGWRDRLRPLGGHAVVRRRIDGDDQSIEGEGERQRAGGRGSEGEGERQRAGGRGPIDVWGPPPSAIELMRRVKHELDPNNRCAPGRFVGGI